jgi:hypothetical protein
VLGAGSKASIYPPDGPRSFGSVTPVTLPEPLPSAAGQWSDAERQDWPSDAAGAAGGQTDRRMDGWAAAEGAAPKMPHPTSAPSLAARPPLAGAGGSSSSLVSAAEAADGLPQANGVGGPPPPSAASRHLGACDLWDR